MTNIHPSKVSFIDRTVLIRMCKRLFADMKKWIFLKKKKIQVPILSTKNIIHCRHHPTSQPSTQLRLPITSNLARDARSCNAVPARNNYAFKYVEALSRWGSNLGLTLSSPGPFVLTLGDNLRQIH